jgi:hypothetical protein
VSPPERRGDARQREHVAHVVAAPVLPPLPAVVAAVLREKDQVAGVERGCPGGHLRFRDLAELAGAAAKRQQDRAAARGRRGRRPEGVADHAQPVAAVGEAATLVAAGVERRVVCVLGHRPPRAQLCAQPLALLPGRRVARRVDAVRGRQRVELPPERGAQPLRVRGVRLVVRGAARVGEESAGVGRERRLGQLGGRGTRGSGERGERQERGGAATREAVAHRSHRD